MRRGVTHTEAVLLAALHGALVASQCSATSLVIATDSSIAVRQVCVCVCVCVCAYSSELPDSCCQHQAVFHSCFPHSCLC